MSNLSNDHDQNMMDEEELLLTPRGRTQNSVNPDGAPAPPLGDGSSENEAQQHPQTPPGRHSEAPSAGAPAIDHDGETGEAEQQQQPPDVVQQQMNIPIELPLDRPLSEEERTTLNDSLNNMLRREFNFRVPVDYLVLSATENIDRARLVTRVDDNCREQMIQWAFELNDHCQFDSDTVAIAIKLTDLYVNQTRAVLHNRDQFQLVLMTGLYIAVKVHERQAFSSSQLAGLSRGKFQPQEIEQLEVEIGMVLQWSFTPPTPKQFFRVITALTSLSAEERQSLETALEEPLRRALTVCENMTMLPSRLLYRVLEVVVPEQLPDRSTELLEQFLQLLDMTRQEADYRPARRYNPIVIAPEDIVADDEDDDGG